MDVGKCCEKQKKKNKSANDRTATHGFEAMCEIIAVGKLVKGTVFFSHAKWDDE